MIEREKEPLRLKILDCSFDAVDSVVAVLSALDRKVNLLKLRLRARLGGIR